MPAEPINHNLQAVSARLKEVYLDNKLITLPLQLDQQDKEAFPIEKAIDMTFLDNDELLPVSAFNEGAAESLDDIERPTQDAHYQRRKISLRNLINCIEGDNGQTKSMLVSGRAGIGKSTLCHLMTHLWAKGGALREVAAVIWLPLKSIKLYNKNTTLSEWIWRACFDADESVKKALKNMLFSDDIKKCLFILDGYDEVEHLIESRPVLRQILKIKAPKLVTTKPHARPDKKYGIEFHGHVENIGFQRKNIAQYIDHYFMGVESEKDLLLKYIERDSNSRTACYIPINLFILCHRWGQKKYDSRPTHHELHARFVRAILRQSSVDTNPKPYLDATAHIAYEQAMATTEPHIEKSFIKKILQNYHASITLEDLLKAGFIKSSTEFTHFSFIHPAFQAYFSAMHFSKIITDGSLEEKTKILNFISRNKYNPAFATTLPFIIAMVCHSNGIPAAMSALWDALLVHDLDMVGLKQQELMILALECSSGHGLPKNKTGEIKDTILNWVIFSIQPKTHDTANQVKNKTMAVLAGALVNAPMVSAALLHRFKGFLENCSVEEQYHFVTNYSEALRYHDTRGNGEKMRDLVKAFDSRRLDEQQNPSELDKKAKQPPNITWLKYAAGGFKHPVDTIKISTISTELLIELISYSEEVAQLSGDIFNIHIVCSFLEKTLHNTFSVYENKEYSTHKQPIINAARALLKLAENKQVRERIYNTAKSLAVHAKNITALLPKGQKIPKERLKLLFKIITLLKPLIPSELFSLACRQLYHKTNSQEITIKDPYISSIFIKSKKGLNQESRFMYLMELIKTLRFQKNKLWQEQLNAIPEIADRLTDEQKTNIISHLLATASGADNIIIITQTDRYTEILKTAKSIFTSLSEAAQNEIYNAYERNIQVFNDPVCLSVIMLLTSSGEIPIKFRTKLTQLLRNPQSFIVSMATALLFKTTTRISDDAPDEDTLLYVYMELIHGNQAEVEKHQRQVHHWLSLNPIPFLFTFLKVSFNDKDKHVFKTFLKIIIESKISIHTLVLAYINLLNHLSQLDNDIETLINEEMYLFDLMLHALQLHGFTLKKSPTLGILVFCDLTGTTPYQFNNSPAPTPGIINRERAIMRHLLNELYRSLQENKLPSSLIGSLLHFEEPPHKQMSAINFYNEPKLTCWSETFPFSPYVVKNSPRSTGGLSTARHLVPNNQLIDDGSNEYFTFYSSRNRDDFLKIKIKRQLFWPFLLRRRTPKPKTKNAFNTINYLDSSENNLDDDDLDKLYKSGFFTPNLRILKLSYNHLTERSLCFLLQNLPGLRYLFIDNNKISFDEGNLNKVKTALANNRSLIHLDVSNNFLPTYAMELTPNPRRQSVMLARPIKYRHSNFSLMQRNKDPYVVEPIFSLAHPALFSTYDGKPIQSILDSDSLISPEQAIACIIAKKNDGILSSPTSITNEHMYLLLEDIDVETSQRRLLRADLFSPDKQNVRFILAQISVDELINTKALEQHTHPYRITPHQIEKIIKKIKQDQLNQDRYNFALLPDDTEQTLNCSKWVFSLLKKIDIHLTKKSIFPSKQLTKNPSLTIS